MSRAPFNDLAAANALGISRPHFTRLKLREKTPSLLLAVRIQDFTGGEVTPRELLSAADAALVKPAAAGEPLQVQAQA